MASSTGTRMFTGPAQIYSFAGLLFDMDGTIVDSTDAIVKHWHKWVNVPTSCTSCLRGTVLIKLAVRADLQKK